MRVGILGRLEVDLDGVPVEIGGVRLRGLLIRLALDAGRPVSVDALAEALWEDSPPADSANAVQTLVSRLRRAVPGLAVQSVPAGYRLDLAGDAVDAHRFERLARAGRDALRAGDPAGAAETLAAALTLWRGPALADVADARYAQIDAAARVADELLARCPRLRILATSREPLGILGEALHPVPPLRLPAADTAAEATNAPSVQLLRDRAAAVRPGFAVTDDNVAAVVEICRRLDGLPLAIELAAARLRTLSPAQVAAGLDDRFRLLTGGSRTALPRHRTLRAVVAWSWDLLTDDERRLADRLAVFPSSVTADSAAGVADGPGATDAAALLDALVDKSLLQVVGDGRFRMLETIREFGLERLAEAGDVAAGEDVAADPLVAPDRQRQRERRADPQRGGRVAGVVRRGRSRPARSCTRTA